MDVFKIYGGDDDEVKENNFRTHLHFHFRYKTSQIVFNIQRNGKPWNHTCKVFRRPAHMSSVPRCRFMRISSGDPRWTLAKFNLAKSLEQSQRNIALFQQTINWIYVEIEKYKFMRNLFMVSEFSSIHRDEGVILVNKTWLLLSILSSGTFNRTRE